MQVLERLEMHKNAEVMRELKASSAWRAYAELLRQEMESVVGRTMNGGTRETFDREQGIYRGLSLAMRLPDLAIEKAERSAHGNGN